MSDPMTPDAGDGEPEPASPGADDVGAEVTGEAGPEDEKATSPSDHGTKARGSERSGAVSPFEAGEPDYPPVLEHTDPRYPPVSDPLGR